MKKKLTRNTLLQTSLKITVPLCSFHSFKNCSSLPSLSLTHSKPRKIVKGVPGKCPPLLPPPFQCILILKNSPSPAFPPLTLEHLDFQQQNCQKCSWKMSLPPPQPFPHWPASPLSLPALHGASSPAHPGIVGERQEKEGHINYQNTSRNIHHLHEKSGSPE